jgi:hypothetical protein
MKRLAVLTLTAALAWSGTSLRAADPVPLPLPTGFAPTSPQVPAPVLVDGVPVAADAARVRLGLGGGSGGNCESGKCGSRLKDKLAGVLPTGGLGDGLYHGKAQWCSDCAPAVRYPLPPLPAGIGGDEVRQAGGSCASGSCAGSGCTAGNCDRNCWQRFKGWLCFRQTPVRTPCVPTLRQPPLYTYFPCHERPGCGTGCATGACATGAVVGVAARPMRGLPDRGVAGCVSCPQPGEAVMPGYRLAAPETPAVTQWSPAPSTVGPVVPSAYKK